MTSAYKRNNFINLLLFILCALPPIACLFYMIHFYYPISYDEWGMIDLVANIEKTGLSFSALWARHNEHRIFFPKIIYMLIAYSSNLRGEYLVVFSFVMLLAYMYIIGLYLRNVFGSKWILCLISALIFSLRQENNLTSGFQIGFIMCHVFAIVSLYFLYSHVKFAEDKNMLYSWRFIMSILCAIVGSFSSLQGIFVWPAGSAAMFFTGKKTRRSKFYWVWNIIALCAIYAYFHNTAIHHMSDYSSRLVEAVRSDSWDFLYTTIKYFCKIFGAAFFVDSHSALLLGAFVIFCFGIITLDVIKQRGLNTKDVFPYSIMLYSLFSLAAITAGRSLLNDPLASRYATSSIAFVLGLLLFLYHHKQKIICKLFLNLLICASLISMLASYHDSITGAQQSQQYYNYYRFVMQTYDTQPEQTLLDTLPIFSTDSYKTWLSFLKQKKWSVFVNTDVQNNQIKRSAPITNSEQILFFLDNLRFIQPTVNPSYVSFDGWIADKNSGGLVKAIYIHINENDYLAYYGIDRPDVVNAYANKNYRYSGFKRDIPIEFFADGENKVIFKIIGADGNVYQQDVSTVLFKESTIVIKEG